MSNIQLDQDDVSNLALCAWKEARGDGDEAMQAVMHVIFNRVGAVGFPRTIHDVIYQKNAFTSMSVSSDPEYNLKPLDGDPQYAYCIEIANAIQSDPDVTNGAHYYENEATATSGWFGRVIAGPDGQGTTEHPLVASIGHQVFFT
jgi:N-acetylmuramoyl-L-alanine amidase